MTAATCDASHNFFEGEQNVHSLEAMTRLIELGNEAINEQGVVILAGGDAELEDLRTAVAVVQAVLNTALPIARFRLHVESITDRREFTVSSANIYTLLDVLKSMREGFKNTEVICSLWEQTATGADMVSGFRGKTRAQNFRMWLKQIEVIGNAPTQGKGQAPQIPGADVAGSEEASVETSEGGEEAETGS